MKKELSHQKDVRGFLVPFEAPDGTTLRRVVTGVMVLAVGLIIVALITLAFHYKSVSEVAQRERAALRVQLSESTVAITGLLEFQASQATETKARTERAIEMVVEQVNAEVRKTIIETHEPLVDEHQRIIDAVE